MKKQRMFDIVSLSDCQPCLGDNQYTNLGQIEIITGGIAVIQSLFPNLFGGGRRRLTSADWNQMFPGNGVWTVRLRNHLANTIKYDADLKNIEPFTRYFVNDNKLELCGAGVSFTACFPRFLEIISQEKVTGGRSPVGRVPGITGTIDYMGLLPYVIGGIALIFFLKQKK